MNGTDLAIALTQVAMAILRVIGGALLLAFIGATVTMTTWGHMGPAVILAGVFGFAIGLLTFARR